MHSSSLVSRSWNGTPIHRRTTDGYVNATAMCKANGKRWTKYRESDRANEYLEALSTEARISVYGLIESKTGGSEGGETWVHPQVAVDLARWISAPFAVWMDGWFLDEMGRASQVREVQQPAALAPAETLRILEDSFSFLERLGVADDRDRLQFGDMVRSVTARASGGLLLPAADEHLALTDVLIECGVAPQEANRLAISLGRDIANRYRTEFEEEPPLRTQSVNGRPTQVKSYPGSWLRQQTDYIANWVANRINPKA